MQYMFNRSVLMIKNANKLIYFDDLLFLLYFTRS